jgi:hypothetical protein
MVNKIKLTMFKLIDAQIKVFFLTNTNYYATNLIFFSIKWGICQF